MTLSASVPGVLGNTGLDRFDAIVVGSGAGGSAATHVLTSAGLNVLVLEAGDNPFPGLDTVDGRGGIPWPVFSNDEIKNSIRRWVWQDALIEPRTFRRSEAETAGAHPDVNVMTRNVGGAAVISGVSYPRFHAIDFRMGSALAVAGRDFPGTSFADWPFPYDEIEPFYAEAEILSGVAGAKEGPDADPFASSRSVDFPLPPQPRMYSDRVLAHGCGQLGYQAYSMPAAVNTAPYRGRSPCVMCGFCTGCGCPINAKGSPAVTTLRTALLSGRCQLRYNAHVARLRLDGARRRVVGVDYIDDGGRTQTVSADHVLLAASAIESARLCFLSDRDGPGIGNASGHLGRHLLFHFQTAAVGIVRQRLHPERGRGGTRAISDFRGVQAGGEELRADRPLGGVVEFGTSFEPISTSREILRPEGLILANAVGASFKQLLVEGPFTVHLATLEMHGEDAPRPTNRIDLDPNVRDVFDLPVPRITYANHRFELDAADYYRPKMLEVLDAAGAAYGVLNPIDPSVPSASRHLMGGLRMGNDPAESVCDAFGRLHDVENLYCADGGGFVTGSGYNPTLTIVAVALRTAAAIVFPGNPERWLDR